MKVINVNTNPKNAFAQAQEILNQGGLIIFPTETCYGLGVDATNPKAVDKLLEYKGARSGQVSVAVSNQPMASRYVIINDTAKHLYQEFLPGPLTVISKSRHQLVQKLESPTGTLGIRIPAYPAILKLIQHFNKPITATSANTSGKKPPYSLKDWQQYTSASKRALVDLFLDAGKLKDRPVSTIIDTTYNDPQIIRQGELTLKTPAFTSTSPEKTQEIAARIFKIHKDILHTHPLIIALQGELGAGKTQFVKGMAKALGLKELINSPTYTIIREYPIGKNKAAKGVKFSPIAPTRPTAEPDLEKIQNLQLTSLAIKKISIPERQQKLYHIDTWRLEKGEELFDLGLKDMLKPGNIIAIEWLQKAKTLLENLNSPILWVTLKQLSKSVREIRYQFSPVK